MKKKIPSVLLVAIFLIGLSLLLYPTLSDYWNQFHQSKMIVDYDETVAGIAPEVKEKLWAEAASFNSQILKRGNTYIMSDDDMENYEKILNISGDGIMGYIEIPSIDCSLPIYHGTDESILQVAAGHVAWSSLPVGGQSTHCVISSHRGLPSAKLFTDLDKVAEGDIFTINVLDELLTYEVDKILIVEPNDTTPLQIEKGKDYCTLVTCTPYGINTHRLLVRGHRIENIDDAKDIHISSDAIKIEPLIIAPILAVPLIIILMILLAVRDKKSHITRKLEK